MEARSCIRTDCGSACAAEREHGRADVHDIGGYLRIASEEPGEEAAVSVTEYQRVLRVRQLGKVREAAALEERAEAEVFQPPVGAGDAIEIGRSEHGELRLLDCLP